MTIALDIFLVLMLAVAIAYGFTLNRRIIALRQDQQKLEKLAISFNNATARAEDGVGKLRAATEGSVQILQQSLAKGEVLSDDLKFLIRRGEDLADKMEMSVRAVERSPQSGAQSSSKNLLGSVDDGSNK